MSDLAFHALTFAAYSLALYYDEYHVVVPEGSPSSVILSTVGGRYKYLTILNLVLQCGYFGVALANDVVGSSERKRGRQSRLQQFRDWLFTSLVFPLGCFVSFIFWSIYAVDRELILPSNMDSWFPCWLNHIMHTLPLVSALLEQVVVYHTHQRGHRRLLPIFLVYLLYLAWLVFIKQRAGFWVYPVFDALNARGRTVFLLCLSVPALFFYVLGEKLHVAIWGYEAAQQELKKRK